MSYDFFNTSNLAFGAKITSAFRQLFASTEQARDNIQSVLDRQAIYSDYLFKNYIVGQPTTKTNPCRTNEILNLVKDLGFIKKLDITLNGAGENVADSVLVDANIYNKSYNINTRITGSRTLTALDWNTSDAINLARTNCPDSYIDLFIYYTPAQNNMSMIVEPRITLTKSELQEDEEFLMSVRLHKSGEYSVLSANSKYVLPQGDFNHYIDIKFKTLVPQRKGIVIEKNETRMEDWFDLTSVADAELENIDTFTVVRDCIVKIHLGAGYKIVVNGTTRYDIPDNVDKKVDTYVFHIFKKGDVVTCQSGDLDGLHYREFSLVSYQRGV